MRRKLIDALVAHGIRAQLKTGNLLTGAVLRFIRLFPWRAAGEGGLVADSRFNCRPLPGQLEATEATVENIIKKLDKVPFQEIGDNLHKAIDRAG